MSLDLNTYSQIDNDRIPKNKKTELKSEKYESNKKVEKKSGNDSDAINNEEGDGSVEQAFNEIGKKQIIQIYYKNTTPKWPNRVFSLGLIRQIINQCSQMNDEIKKLHFDPTLAKQRIIAKKNEDFLILHLTELIRVAFITATSSFDPLKIAGLELLEDIIKFFAKVEDPEFPNHFLLEQYQAQISAALRPQFIEDTSACITSMACQVCSSWITKYITANLSDLQQIYNLMVSSLKKLADNIDGTKSTVISNANNQLIYSELSITVEKLSVLRAWAEVRNLCFKLLLNRSDYF